MTNTYKYFKTDHLGNVRVLLAVDGYSYDEQQTLIAEQNTDYYPFGLAHGQYENLHLNRFLFSGKELQDAPAGAHGMLGWYDFGFRHYNPLLGHWMTQDILAQFENPYLYCMNDPANCVDPNGLWGLFPGGQERDDGTIGIYPVNCSSGPCISGMFDSRWAHRVNANGSSYLATGGSMDAYIRDLKNQIKETKDYFLRFMAHYSFGLGKPITLTNSEFREITDKGRIKFKEDDVNEIGDNVYETHIDLYKSDFGLRYAFGTATVYFQFQGESIELLGLYDNYNFDGQPWGDRSVLNEIITRLYGCFIFGIPFDINYYSPGPKR